MTDLLDQVVQLETDLDRLGVAMLELGHTIQTQKLELAKLRDAFDDAVALLRDWEDYDPDDRESGWLERRDEFLAEHEEAGR